jgi:hypothetical protein
MIVLMQLPGIESVVWLGSLSLGLCNMVLVVRRNLHRRLKWLFFYLMAYAGGGTVVWLLTPYLSRRAYGVAYWIGQVPVLVLAMLLVYSFWKAGLAKYAGLHQLCQVTLVLTVVGGLVAVIFTTGFGSGVAPTAAKWLNEWLILFYRSTMVVIAALLWTFFGFVSFFRIQVSRTIRDLALGLFFYALVRVVTESYFYLRGALPGSAVDYIRLLAGFLMQCQWCAAIVRHHADQPVETAPALALHFSQEELERRMDAINLTLVRLLR